MMPTRRNKILTMLFGLLPGAGHMFMGFMHLGLSYMLIFFGTISVIFFLDNIFYYFEFIGFLLPVIWCYAFFDCLNKCYASDEEFYLLEDHFLFTENGSLPTFKHNFNFRLGKYARLILGWFLTVSGSLLLLRNFLRSFANSVLWDWDNYIYRFLREILDEAPRFLSALVIIVLGLWLIFGKRKELKDLKSMMNQAEEEDYRHGREYQAPEDFSFSEGFHPLKEEKPPKDGKPSEVFPASEVFKQPEEPQPPKDDTAPEIVLTLEDAAAEDVSTFEGAVNLDENPLLEEAKSKEAPQPPARATEEAEPLEDIQENPEEAQRHE